MARRLEFGKDREYTAPHWQTIGSGTFGGWQSDGTFIGLRIVVPPPEPPIDPKARERARKVFSLMQRPGTPGEGEAARQALMRMIVEHSWTQEDLHRVLEGLA